MRRILTAFMAALAFVGATLPPILAPQAYAATLFDGRFRVTDANNNPLNGGKVRVYNANTTTLATVYSDAALTVPLTNPVVADSGGWAPMIFLASGNYDVATLTSAGVVVKTQDDLPSLGSDNSTFIKDYTNSRVQITGSGGTIAIEAGDASPDNSGGTGVLRGWNGTTADSWTITANTVNASVAGSLKEAGKKLPSVVYTEATTFTAVTSVVITLPNSPTGVVAYEVEIFDYSQSGNGTTVLTASFDGGANYKTGASDYKWVNPTGVASTGTSLLVVSNLNGGTNQPGRIFLRIKTVDSGNDQTQVVTQYAGVINTGDFQSSLGGFGYVNGSYGRATQIKLTNTANMTGKYIVRPLRGYGE